MNTLECCEMLEKLSQTSSKNDKILILKNNNYSEIKSLLSIALNPYEHYGVVDFDDGKIYRSDIPTIDETVSLKSQLVSGDVTGYAARDKMRETLLCENELVRKWLIRIFKKDLKAGIAAKIVNKAYPKLIPEFQLALCDVYEDSKELPKGSWVVEAKLDGLRCITIIDDKGKMTFLSRSGKQLYNTELIENELKTAGLKNVVLDGEMYAKNWNDSISILHTQEDRKDKDKIVYFIFDFLTLDEWKSKKTAILDTRKIRLDTLFLNINGIPKNVWVHKCNCINTYEEAKEHLDFYVSKGYEGIVLKDLDASYPFKRSKSWLKWKLTETYDITITNFLVGTGKHKGRLGAFICEFNGKKGVKVGSGFTDQQREEFWVKRNELLGKVVEVQCQEKTKDGSLRFPVFVRIREDR